MSTTAEVERAEAALARLVQTTTATDPDKGQRLGTQAASLLADARATGRP